ncbi:unnamed protein product [Cyprideis torosa]|uniref:Uncharacterized protein n=1 Tax=Cyprideis torosa TaxID=163714 RepID=A0A7R8WWA0_9CRUS|nr:unnamed protein product [Cyprideis torosa]CAG0911478.1 unnamed protein product [Cyprideis torosa]
MKPSFAGFGAHGAALGHSMGHYMYNTNVAGAASMGGGFGASQMHAMTGLGLSASPFTTAATAAGLTFSGNNMANWRTDYT